MADDRLSIEITSNAESARESIFKLAKETEKLGKATGEVKGDGIKDTAESAEKAEKALGKLSMSSQKVKQALSGISDTFKNTRELSKAAERFKEFGGGVKLRIDTPNVAKATAHFKELSESAETTQKNLGKLKPEIDTTPIEKAKTEFDYLNDVVERAVRNANGMSSLSQTDPISSFGDLSDANLDPFDAKGAARKRAQIEAFMNDENAPDFVHMSVEESGKAASQYLASLDELVRKNEEAAQSAERGSCSFLKFRDVLETLKAGLSGTSFAVEYFNSEAKRMKLPDVGILHSFSEGAKKAGHALVSLGQKFVGLNMKAFGKEMQFVGARANLAKALLYTINGGVDERTGDQVAEFEPITD
jgi:hypothetical protein